VAEAIRGISIANTGTTSATNVYYNTVYINATSSGTNFGSTGIYHAASATATTATLDLRNNIIANLSTPNGTGYTVAYRRSVGTAGTLSNYTTTSNNNLFYAGTPGTYRLIYSDGTSSAQTLALYKSGIFTAGTIAPRDQASVTENPPFLSVIGSSAGFLKINTTAATFIESGAVNIATFTTDFDGDIRAGNPGYPAQLNGYGTAPDIGADEFDGRKPNVVVSNANANSNGNYLNLGAAFIAINAYVQTGNNIIVTIVGNTTETTTVTLNAGAWTTLKVYPVYTGLTITGNISTAPLIDLNGAGNVTIDGRVNQTGSVKDLTITNTSTGTSSSTIRFIESADNNTVKYCIIKGAAANAVAGVIFFSTATAVNGNDGNTIDNNNITSDLAGRPLNAIYSAGTASFDNSGNTISNNNIYNFLNNGTASNGIYLAGNTTTWTISGNNFYETGSFVPTASVTYNAIYINNTSGTGFTITGNYFGGNTASCGGSAWTKTNSFDNIFNAINLKVGTGTASSVQNNTIKNFSWSNSGAAPWTAINIVAGDVNIGTSTANTIGDTISTGSITVTEGATAANVYGINISSTGTVDCENNIIGSITAANSATLATNFYGINKTAVAGTTSIINNTLGGSIQANCIQASSASTANAQSVYGIYNAGTGIINISENNIGNMTNRTTNTTGGTIGLINGITSINGTDTITNNTIGDLTIANANTSSTNTASVCGIALTGATLKTVTGNTIYNLSNTYISFAGSVIGIYFSGSTGANVVSGNFIYSLSVTGASSSAATLYGIRIAAGATTYYNNIISLGGNTCTTLYGIYETGAPSNNNNLYFNTVYIGGTPTAGALNSYALYSDVTTNTRDFRNNIFDNSRSNNGATGKHYTAYFNYAVSTNLTLDYNDYYAPGSNGVLGYYNGSDVTLLPLITGMDAESLPFNPNFVNAGSTVATDYKIGIDLSGVNGTGIIIDFGLNSRSSSTTMGAWERNINKWKGSISDDWNNPANWTSNTVPVVNANIVFDDAPNNHCRMDQDRSVTDITNNQSTYRIVTNGHKLIVNRSLHFTNGAQIDASSTNSTVEFDGWVAQSIPSGAFYNNGVYNLTINNAHNLTLNGSLRLLNNLTATLGRLDAFTNSPTVIYAGSSAQTIGSNLYLNDEVYNLTIDNSSGVQLGNSETVNGTLTLTSGRLTLGAYNLSLGASASAVAGTLNSSNMIVADGSGELRKNFSANSSYVFPVGDATGTAEYSPITINFASGTYSGGAYTGIKVTNAKHPNNASATNYLNRYWTITSSGISSFSCDVTGTYVTADIAGLEGSQVAGKYSGSLPWIKYSTLSANTLTASGVTSFGDFTGITAAPPTVTIDANPGLTVWQNYSLSLTANPVGDATFTYLWSPGGATTQVINPSTATLGSTDYYVTVTDGNGFVGTASVTVVVTLIPVGVSASAGLANAGYANLKLAFDKINDGTHKGIITVKINLTTTETASAVLNASCTGGSTYTFINIYPTATGLSVSGNLASPLIDLNGAAHVNIDGRVNAAGSTKDLSITNTNASATAGTSTIRFINDATNNIVKYCNIEGSSTDAAAGIIFFSTTTGTTGNKGDTIYNNNITNSADANRPLNAIYSAGTASFDNSGNTISNNNIYNFLNNGTASNGINLAGNTTTWTISGNNFYETSSFVPTASVVYNAININNTFGTGFTVSGNYIGGQATQCGGSAWTKTNAFDNIFNAINMNVGTGTASSIQNNTIRNFIWGNSLNASWTGINIAAGDVNIGTSTANTIGAITGTGSIAITGSTSGANVYGINIASTGTVDCRNNTIGAITAANAAANASNFYGINKTSIAGTTTISNNTIGSTTDANSIQTSSGSTGAAQSVYGIYNAGTGTININYNLIANLTNSTTNTNGGTIGLINGITSTDGTNTIANNTIRTLTIANANTSSANTASVCGIALTGATLKTVSGNIIYNLSNTYASFAGNVIGLYFTGSTGANVVSSNFIYSLSTGASSSATLYGVRIAAGATTYFNNIINLGGNTCTTLYGIYESGAASNDNNLYFNTVYIGGKPTAGALNSYALYSDATTNTRNFRNNIFDNSRSNNGATGKHYTAYFNYAVSTNLTLDYNDYYAPGTDGVLGYYNGSDVTSLPLITGMDVESLPLNPYFVNAGSSIATDYKIGINLIGVNGTGITIDFGLNPRSSSTAMGAWERIINKWKGSTSDDWNTPANWTNNTVPVVNANIVFDDAPNNHCRMDQDRSVTDIINNQSTYRIVTNGHKLIVNRNLNFTNGAQIDASAINSTIEFDGWEAQSIPSGAFYNNECYNLSVNNWYNVTLNGTLRLLNTITTPSGLLDAFTNLPTVSYAGTSAQTVESDIYKGDTIYNLTIDNSSGVTLNTDFTINNNLVINSGKLFAIAAGKGLIVSDTITNSAGNAGFVLQSDATGTASLMHNTDNVPATVQRYISGNVEDWHFLSSPVVAQSISGAWLPSGTYGNGTGYDLYVWNEPNSCWIYKLNTTSPINWNTVHPSADFVVGRGYLYSVQATNPTKTFVGNLNNDTISYGLTFDSDTLSLKGFNLVGNPYPSSVDWYAATGWTRTNLVSNGGGYDMWIWNPTANNYGVYNSADADGVGTNSVSRYIAPMQGYFVRAASDGDLTMDNDVRILNGASSWFKQDKQDINRVSLCVKSDAGYGFDEIRLNFGYPENENGARKLFSKVLSAPSLFMATQTGNLSVHYFTNTQDNPVVPVSFTPGMDGNYTINCNFDQSKFDIVMLEDRKTHYIQNMKTAKTYSFKASKGDDANRFVLYFGPDNDISDGKLPGRIYTDGSYLIIDLTLVNDETEVYVYDLIGRLLLKQNLAGEMQHELNFDADAQILLVYLRNPYGSLCRKLFWRGNGF